jgi:hypothetical protein
VIVVAVDGFPALERYGKFAFRIVAVCDGMVSISGCGIVAVGRTESASSAKHPGVAERKEIRMISRRRIMS